MENVIALLKEIMLPIALMIFGSSGFWAYIQSKSSSNGNKELLSSVKEVHDQVVALDTKIDYNEAKNARNRIVKFADEIRNGTKHSKDLYDHIMIDIDFYEDYCEEHKDFKNSIAEISMKKIRQNYEKDDFL